MRLLLGVLRDDAEDAGAMVADRHPQPGLPQLAELIDAAREATASHATRLIVSGPVADFDPGVELAAYRIVQEALTNVRRHAPGAAVDVELRYDDHALHLRIRDNGPGPEDRNGRRRLQPRRRRAPAGTACSACASEPWPSAGRCGRAPPRAADSASRPTCRPSRRSHDHRDRRRRRPRGGAGRVRRHTRHAAGLQRARHRRRRRRGRADLPGAQPRRRPDGHPDAGHGRHRGHQAADVRAPTRRASWS